MSAIKNYYLTLLEHCSEERFGQEAVEWAILTGRIKPTCNLPDDLTAIFTADDGGNTPYDLAVEGYQRQCQEHGDALVQLYRATGLLEQVGCRHLHDSPATHSTLP
jgi:hypothetical protein